MITKTHTLSEPFWLPDTLAKESCAFFDIETTGLYWKQSHLYAIGIIRFWNAQWVLTQYFAQKPSEEASLLEHFAHSLQNIQTLIHFNGSSFDLPYLQKKYFLYGLENPLETLDSLDLYQRTRICQSLFSLPSFRQKDAEELLGIHRQDRFCGKELIALYQKYLRTADEALLQILLLHNHDDLVGMTKLTALLAFPALFDGKFSFAESFLTANKLTLVFSLSDELPLPFLREAKGCRCSAEKKRLCIELWGVHATLKYFFSNYKDYYYLPLEDTAIHKSVASYVDRQYRQRAKASNCYQKKQGLFFLQPKPVITPAFWQEYKGQECYFLWEEKQLPDSEALCSLAVTLLHSFLSKD